MRRSLLILFVFGTPVFADSTLDLPALVRQALSGLNGEDDRRAEWGYTVNGERREFESNGKVKSQRTYMWKRELMDGHFVGISYERDGKPLTAEERARNRETTRQRVAELNALSPQERERRRAEARRKGKEEDSWIQELPEALTFQLVGEEMMNGRATYHLAADPKPGYQPKNLRAKIFEKLRGHLWIDKGERELVRAEAEIFDTVGIGFGILGKVEKGTQFQIARRRLSDGVWLQESSRARFQARVVFKSMSQESITRYSDFKHRRELEMVTQKPAVGSPVNARATQN